MVMHVFKRAVSLILAVLVFVNPLYAQHIVQSYSKGRVFLKSGARVEGKALRITVDTVSLEINGTPQSFLLSETLQIMGKNDNSMKYGGYCGGILALIMLEPVFTGNTEGTIYYDDGTEDEIDLAPLFIVFSVLAGALGFGLGFGTGKLISDWQVVYSSP